MTKANLLKLLHAIADKKDVEFFDSDKWILLSKGWGGMSELLFYIDEVCSNYKNFRIKPQTKLKQSTRKCGFYWVKVISEDSNEVAYWNGAYWELTGTDSHYKNEELEIDENQIKR